jgi:hypothetical protein
MANNEPTPPRTTINGKDAVWPENVVALWQSIMANVDDERPVTNANFFTPRPYVDEYNRGSKEAGFVYIRARDVFIRKVNPEVIGTLP